MNELKIKTFVRGTALALVAAIATTGAANAAINELFVTAQKRTQNIQDVPIAVTALEASFLEKTGFENIYDLADYAPGISFTQAQTSTQATVLIRGVATSGQNAGLEPSVGTFIDGVYRSRTGAAVLDFVDVERIEVLRGPQGTLFGKNTTSGALNIVTKKPEYEFGGQAEVSLGNLDYVSAKGTVTGPVVDDKLAARLAAYTTNREGFVDNVTTGIELNDINRWGVRGQLLFNPNDDWDIRLIADYSETDETCCAGVTLVNGPTDAALGALGGTVIPGSEFEDRNVAVDFDPISDTEDYGVSLEMNWDVGSHTLTSITGWRRYEFLGQFKSDFTNVPIINLNSQEWSQEAFTQEFRISNDESERFRYTAGFYYFNQDLDLNEQLRFGSSASAYVDLIGAINADVSAGLTDAFGGLLSGDPANPTPITAIVAPGALAAANPFPDGSGINDFYQQEHESWALFAHGTYDVTDQFSVTAGLRYVDESKELTAAFNEMPAGGVTIPPGTLPITTTPDVSGLGLTTVPLPVNLFAAFQPTSPLVGPGFTSEFDDEAVVGTIKLQYDWNDDLLTYVSYARGYKSGGTNVSRVIAPMSFDFKPEEVDSYEIGFKGDFLDNRLRINAAAYLADYQDFQDNTFLGTGFVLQNAGKIEAKGVEVEAVATPSDWLTLEGHVTWQDVEYESFTSGPCQAFEVPDGVTAGSCDRSGDDVANTPEWVVHGAANVEHPIGTLLGFARAEFTWRDDQITNSTNDPRGIQESYTTVAANLGIRDEDGIWEVSVWGRNLTDETWYNLSFDGTLQTGKLYAYPSEPRTYGVTLRTRF